MAVTMQLPVENGYWKFLVNLSEDIKLDLITLLSQSLKQKGNKKKVSAKDFYGIWGNDGIPGDEFVNEIRSLRSFNQEIVKV